MIKRQLVAICAVLLGLGIASSHALPSIAADSNQDPKIFLNDLAASLGKLQSMPNFWPGFNVTAEPILVYIDNNSTVGSTVYAYFFTPKTNEWEKQIIGKMIVYSKTHVNWGNLQPDHLLNINTLIEDQPVYLSWRNSLSSLVNQRLEAYLENESPSAKARTVQKEQFRKAAYNSYRDAENISLVYLEQRILNDYLIKFNEDILKDFAAVESYREMKIGIDNFSFEKSTFLLGHYPYLKLSTNSKEEYAKIAIAEDDKTPLSEALKSIANSGKSIYKRNYLNFTYTMLAQTATKVALALDIVRPNWKTSMSNNANSILDILVHHYSLDKSEVAQRLAAAKARYDYAEIDKAINAEFVPYWKDAEREQTIYKNNAGIVVKLINHRYAPFISDFSPDQFKSYQIDINSRLSVSQNPQGSEYLYHGGITAEGNGLAQYWERIAYTVDGKIEYQFEQKFPLDAMITIDGVKESLLSFVSKAQEPQSYEYELTIEGQDPTTGPMLIDVRGYRGVKISVTKGQLIISN